MATILRTRVWKHRETPEAICISHPNKPLKTLFLPKSEIRDMDEDGLKKGYADITIPDWLAEKHDL